MGEPEIEPEKPTPRAGTSASALVAAGILLSRMAGLVREAATAQFLGTTIYADAFRAGLRMPNFLQNLLGEGTLSASFIPVYSELLHEGRKEEAGRVAGAIFALLLALAGALSLGGVLLAEPLTSVFLPGFSGEQRRLTIQITRIIFPMTGMLVLSAWSLGILNSHRKFFIPYVAPVLWNVAIIAALYLFGGRVTSYDLVVAVSWGALVGGALQFLVQLPWVLRLERGLKVRWDLHREGVRVALRNAGPAVMGRGVVQLSSYADAVLASFLAAGAFATFTYATTLYVLPVSLFGMSVAAAELPELARQRTGSHEVLRERTRAGLERIAFYVVPSFMAFMALGDVVVATLYQRGKFVHADTLNVWVTLAGLAAGLLATTTSRLFSSTFFALRDTRTPARYATVRVVLSIVLGIILMLAFEGVDSGVLHIPGGPLSGVRVAGRQIGVFGLALGAGIAAWVEWALLKRALHRKIGGAGARGTVLARMFVAAGIAAAVGWGIKLALPPVSSLVSGVVILGAYGVVYFVAAAALGLGEARAFFGRFTRLIGKRR
jgi:putative peptidoglycan lipid II flippase